MKWKTLRHNGVAFPPPFELHNLTVNIKGQPVSLTRDEEEMLMAWAKKKDTPYVQDPVFQENFTNDLKKKLAERHGDRFSSLTLGDMDWSELYAIADREKTTNLSPEEKKQRSAERKTLREELKAKFGMATIDDIPTEIGAYLVEPPGILMGRGAHPLRGRWKRRVEPEDVILNLDNEAPVPPAPEGHHWKEIVHKHDSLWVASWWDELSEKQKYVWLADSSHLRQERDREKYLKASKLESGLDRVRAEIRKGMDYADLRVRALDKKERPLRDQIQALNARLLQVGESGNPDKRKKIEEQLAGLNNEKETLDKQRQRLTASEMKKRQIATVCYLIDCLAMRVGDEKDEDEADTVGASTLRVEHVQIGETRIEFDFLGKDSVQWQKFLAVDDGEEILARNLRDFMRDKQPGQQIFDQIGSTHVNQFLSSIVPGLTAKVFRTYHATTTVRRCLKENGNLSRDAATFEKEYTAKLANLEAAITCNHKRTPPKNWQENLAKKEQMVETIKAATPDIAKLKQQIPVREAALKKLGAERAKWTKEAPGLIEKKKQTLAKLQTKPEPASKKDAAKLKKQRRAAEQALRKAQEDFKRKTQTWPERVAKAKEELARAREAPERAQREYQERFEKAKRQLQLAKATRDYNLGTSLKNYIDPRVYKAWGDYVGFDWKRLYTQALQRKFAWVEQSRVRWSPAGQVDSPEEDSQETETEGD